MKATLSKQQSNTAWIWMQTDLQYSWPEYAANQYISANSRHRAHQLDHQHQHLHDYLTNADVSQTFTSVKPRNPNHELIPLSIHWPLHFFPSETRMRDILTTCITSTRVSEAAASLRIIIYITSFQQICWSNVTVIYGHNTISMLSGMIYTVGS